MTDGLRFCVLVDFRMPATDLDGRPLLSHDRGADRLASALNSLGHDVLLQEAPLAEAPRDRWVLYFGADPEQALLGCGPQSSALEARLIIMDEDRVGASELIEALSVPFIVTSRSFRNWLHNPAICAQVIGQIGVARRLGIAMTPDESAGRYLEFVIPDVPLPEGLVRACASMG